MNIQDLKDVVEKAEKDEKKRVGKSKTVEGEYAFYGCQYSWLLDMVKRYLNDNMEEKNLNQEILDLLDYYDYHWKQFNWLIDSINEQIEYDSEKFITSSIDNTINLKLTYHELSNLLDLIEMGLIQKGLDSVEDDTKKLYYSLINTWGEHAGCENDN